ncbi:hypothetical protein QUA35_29065 [Microcoleus sp. N9_B2]|uniref:hypothetical protein n=1 Tax=unclassified Microcoleus TaxID=2642155 RepID=UPI002FD61E84
MQLLEIGDGRVNFSTYFAVANRRLQYHRLGNKLVICFHGRSTFQSVYLSRRRSSCSATEKWREQRFDIAAFFPKCNPGSYTSSKKNATVDKL